MVVSNQVLPNPAVYYGSVGGEVRWEVPGSPPVYDASLWISPQDGQLPVQQPSGDWTFDTTFFFDYFYDVEIDGEDLEAAGTGTARMVGTAPGGGGAIRDFDIELLSLDISGTIPTAPPMPFMLRESPTLASTGKLLLEDVGSGQYGITSFFDVFTDLSLDGGATWHAAVAQVPEPSAIWLAVICGLAVSAARRNCQRRIR